MNISAPLVALAISWLLAAWLSARLWRLRARFREVAASCAAAQAGEASVTRALQLFAHELQSLALGLRGHVDRLAQDRHRSAASLAVLTSQLGHLADELAQHLTPAAQSHHLHIEPVALAPLMAEAIAAMQAAISPGRRHFRVSENSPVDVTLHADRRALRLILARVLGEAIRSSAQDDWVDIFWDISPSGLALHVADEGAGSVLPALAGVAQDSRGIGLRLSLARSLAQAHGGTLEVEAMAKIGTRVVIHLPMEVAHSQWLTECSPAEIGQTLGGSASTAHILSRQPG